jgi:putative ABC transport system ATP-binding protein
MNSAPVLRAEGLVKTFGSGHTEVRAVDGVSLAIQPGEFVLVMGPSGSGKTTLLSMLGALLRPSAGRIFLQDQDITGLRESELPGVRARSIGFIFQSFNLLQALSVEENVLFPARLAPTGLAGARGRADALLSRLDLTHRRKALPGTLSGGEKQRVAIARALINEPPLILADEPTGNLDSQKGQEVTMILHDIVRDEGRSVLLVTHDPRVEEVADRILWLEDGKLRDRKTEQHDWVRDPVCGMRVDAWTATARTEHQGRTIAFCSEGCRGRFLDNPGAYPMASSGGTV